ncbi:GNAT family N-acetyltransferase [Amycolatopsis sp. La24]|uniref:GNAT family N-acetyltransferase n=1 Tax=Amycolatopsis sp. La24 TaxID=3028304 RepID=UPI0023B1E7A4|nr:GNAT family N-acetyltransferase [Amycolatopsis sp. La24]
MFAAAVTRHWLPPVPDGGGFSLTVDAALDEDERLTVLVTADGRTRIRLTPAMTETLGRPRDEPEFRQRLASAGIVLHGADNLFYFTDEAREKLLAEPDDASVRPLTGSDAEAFAAFEAAASEQDLDDASVELDHWAVYGAFADGQLAAVASMYPWLDAPLADLGVVTLPAHRGKGHARRLVRAISRHALGREHEPQYRCQLDNHASIALAASAGLTLFGTWDIVSPGSPR